MDTARHLAGWLVKAIQRAPVVSNLFAQGAAGMVHAAASDDGRSAAILRSVFVRRSILSLSAAATVTHLSGGASHLYEADDPETPVGLVAIDGRHMGISVPLALEASSRPRHYAVRSAGPDSRSIDPAGSLTAAQSFTHDIMRRGRVDFAHFGGAEPMFNIGARFTTHHLVADNGSARLARRCFDCGLHRD